MYTRYRDELGTPIYEGDTVLLTDRDGKQYLGKVIFDGDFGGGCIRLAAYESQYSGTGWASMAGCVFSPIRTFKQFKRHFRRGLRHVRVSCRGYTTLISNVHMVYAHGQ